MLEAAAFFWKPPPARANQQTFAKPGKPPHTSGACEIGSAKTLPKDLAAREAKTPTGSTALASAAGQPRPHSGGPPALDSGGFLKESAGSAAGFRGASCSGGRDDGGVRGEEERTGAGGRRPLRLLPLRPRRQEPQIG